MLKKLIFIYHKGFQSKIRLIFKCTSFLIRFMGDFRLLGANKHIRGSARNILWYNSTLVILDTSMLAIKLLRSFAIYVKDSKTLKPKVEELIKKIKELITQIWNKTSFRLYSSL